MSSNCGNPDCPTHGEGDHAKSLRKTLADVKSNDELMSAIRVLAANVHSAAIEEADRIGYPVRREDEERMEKILAATNDQDPSVQGIIRGLSVLLSADHEPTKLLTEKCAEIKEAPYAVERLVELEKQRIRERMSRGPLVMSFSSEEEMMAYLKSRH